MALVITKLDNNQVEVTGGSHPYTLLGSYEVNLAEEIDGVKIVREGKMKDQFIQSNVTQVVRGDGTIVPIADKETLYSELKEFFFFEVGGTGGGGTVVTTSYVESILVADWILDGGGRYYVDAVHNLNTKDLLIEAYNIATNDTEVLDDYERTSITTVRIWSTVNTGEYEVLISNGGSATVINALNVDDTIVVDASPLAVGGKLIKVIGTAAIDITVDTGFLSSGETVVFANKTAFAMNFIIGTQDVKASGSNSFVGFGQYSLVTFVHDGTDVILSGDTA